MRVRSAWLYPDRAGAASSESQSISSDLQIAKVLKVAIYPGQSFLLTLRDQYVDEKRVLDDSVFEEVAMYCRHYYYNYKRRFWGK